MGKNYSFNIDYAKKYGVDEAIILEHIIWWSVKNKANNFHFHMGRYWTYNGMEAWHRQYPFWSAKQIRRILSSLVKQGVVLCDKLNYGTHNQMLWYAVVDQNMLKLHEADALKYEDSGPYQRPTKSEIDRLIEEADKVNPNFPIYTFMDKVTKLKGYPPPPNVIIKACRNFLKYNNDQNRPIRNPWGWFTKVVRSESGVYFADLNISQAREWQKAPVAQNGNLKSLIDGIVMAYEGKEKGAKIHG